MPPIGLLLGGVDFSDLFITLKEGATAGPYLTLAAAQEAMLAGRVDQPPDDSAWTHYREALDLDPGNEAARAGLASVQAALIERALAYARDLDFETADRVLEDAALVTDGPDTVLRAKDEISEFREEYAAELEVQAVSAMDAGRFEQAERALIGLVALGGMDSEVNRLRRRMEEARVYGGLKPGQVIRDHFVSGGGWSPESVIVEAGSFQMGSIAFEEGRQDNEGPQHRVTFRRGFAIGQREVSVAEFRVFSERTGYMTDAERGGLEDARAAAWSRRWRRRWACGWCSATATARPWSAARWRARPCACWRTSASSSCTPVTLS